MCASTAVNQFLIDKNICRVINKQCKAKLVFSVELEDFVENELLVAMNDLEQINLDENRINQAVFILFAQAVKSFKSCLLLATNGYYTNTLIDSRSIIEIIFNIKYILEEASKKTVRANAYLTKKDYWTDATVKDRAFLSLDKPLHSVYKIICNYSHANYMGAGQNNEGNFISIYPSEEKIINALELVNSLYYYLIKFIVNYYNICVDSFIKIEIPHNLSELIDLYETEQNIVNFILDILFKGNETLETKEEWIKDYKNFSANKKKKKFK